MADTSLSERAPHDEAEALLPWYATGQLDPDDRAKVERHLYSCGSCRQQLAVERSLIGEFRAMTPEVDSGWARLKNRIEPPLPAPPRRLGFLEDLRGVIGRPAVAALAAAQLAIVGFGATLLSLSQPAYHALGSTPAPAAANVIVMFGAGASEADVRAALRDANASIVGGPTTTGAYLLHVDPRQRQIAIGKLEASRLVQMAQPIDGASS